MSESIPSTYDECHSNCKHIVRECKAMSIKDVAKHYGIAEITVRKKYLNGTFPMFKILNRVRGFSCWISVAIRNPELIKENLGDQNPQEFSTDKTLREVS